MNTRLALASLLCALLAASAGCAAIGGGAIDSAALNESASYDWETNATVTYNLTGENYRAVVDVAEGTTVPVYITTQVEGETPVSISALQFRYPNGTVVSAAGGPVAVENTGSRVLLTAERPGQLAFVGPAGQKTFQAPADVDGSYEVILPPGMRVDAFLFGNVAPGGYSDSLDTETNRVTLRWESLEEGLISVRYYLERDVDIFLGFVVLLTGVAVAGVVHYRRQIRALAAQRAAEEEIG